MNATRPARKPPAVLSSAAAAALAGVLQIDRANDGVER